MCISLPSARSRKRLTECGGKSLRSGDGKVTYLRVGDHRRYENPGQRERRGGRGTGRHACLMRTHRYPAYRLTDSTQQNSKHLTPHLTRVSRCREQRARAWRATRGFYSAVSEVARRASRGTVRLGIVRGRESLRTLSGEKSLRLVAPGTRAVAVGSALSPLLHSVRQTGH